MKTKTAPKPAPKPALKPIRALAQGRSDLWKVKRKDVLFAQDTTDLFAPSARGAEVPEGLLNPRVDLGDLDSLARQIAQFGIQVPLPGHVDPKGKRFIASHGERRLTAYDLAVAKYGLDPRSDKALIPVQTERQHTDDFDRIALHVVLNNGKPLDQFEQGRAFDALLKKEGNSEESVAHELGFSITHVRNCLALVRDASPELQQAVAEGKIAPTTAIDLHREVPRDAQPAIVEQAVASAAHRGKGKATAQDVPVPLGKAAQKARKGVFEGKACANPATDARGNFIGAAVQSTALLLSTSKAKAEILTAVVGGTIHVGYKVKWPAAFKGDGFLHVAPRLNGPTTDTPNLAHILALQSIRAEFEAKTFKDREKVLEDIDAKLQTYGADLPATGAEAPKSKVHEIYSEDPVASLADTLKAIDAKDAEKDRLKTAKKVHAFLKGSIDGKDLTKFILGIE